MKKIFSKLRKMSGGRLTQEQVDAGNAIVEQVGQETLAQLLNVHSTMTISEQGYALIKQFEGLRLNAYLDSANVATIGYGTIKYPNGKSVKMGDTCTKEQAEEWLQNDCEWVVDTIDKHVKVTLTQSQYDALASFIYNVGETQFAGSTLLKRLNSGDIQATAEQFGVWVNAGGKRVQGLVNRREQEKNVFLT